MKNSVNSCTDFDTRNLDMALQTILIIIAICVTWLVSVQNINWDEFYFLSHIHNYVNELPLPPLQTFHVHLLKWIAFLPAGEIGQITVGRFLMVVFLCATTYFVYKISREFVEKTPALVGALAYLTSGYTIGHGASFRTDPVAAFSVMFALYILFTCKRNAFSLASVAILSSIALLITMKSSLFLPAYLAVLVWRFDENRVVRDSVLVITLTVSFYTILFAVHKLVIVGSDFSTMSAASGMLEKTIFHNTGLFPRLPYIQLWSLLSIGMLLLATIALWTSKKKNFLIVILLVGPALSIVVYRNAFPYFFPYITPTLAIASAIGAGRLLPFPGLLGSVIVFMTICFGTQFWHFSKQDQNAQKQLISAVKYLFPEPINYIDRNSMISSYPKVGFFMSSWGVEGYRERGMPVFKSLIRKHEPPLVVANGPALVAALYDLHEFSECCGLLPEDVMALKENYLPYWGWLWVAGKELELEAGRNVVTVSIGGEYRLESNDPVIVNGVNVLPGATVELVSGQANVTSDSPQVVQFIWDVPARPSIKPDSAPVYAGFRSL